MASNYKLIKMIRSCAILFSILIVISCNKHSESNRLDSEESAVISLLIDKRAKAFPFPGFLFDSDTLGDGPRIDSLEAVRVEVVIDTVLMEMNNSIQLEDKYAEFQPLANKLASIDKTLLDPHFIKSEEGHKLVFGNSLKDSGAEYPQLISFSNVAFNKERNNALVYGGTYMGKLNSSVSLYLLERRNGVWEIVFRRVVEKS